MARKVLVAAVLIAAAFISSPFAVAQAPAPAKVAARIWLDPDATPADFLMTLRLSRMAGPGRPILISAPDGTLLGAVSSVDTPGGYEFSLTIGVAAPALTPVPPLPVPAPPPIIPPSPFVPAPPPLVPVPGGLTPVTPTPQVQPVVGPIFAFLIYNADPTDKSSQAVAPVMTDPLLRPALAALDVHFRVLSFDSPAIDAEGFRSLVTVAGPPMLVVYTKVGTTATLYGADGKPTTTPFSPPKTVKDMTSYFLKLRGRS